MFYYQLFFILIACVVVGSRYAKKNDIYKSFPRVANPSWLPNMLGKSPNALIADGYGKYIVRSDTPFVVEWWAKDYLILPPRYLSDVTRMKAENASFLRNFSDAVNLHHSVGNLYDSDRMGEILRKGMNPILSSLTPLMVEEIESAIDKELGHSSGWRSFKATDTFIMISHRVVSRLLAGEELSRQESFIHNSLKFGDSAFVTGLIVAQLPVGPFRPVFAWILSQYHKILLRRVMRQTEPVVQKRMDEADRLGGATPRYNDSIEWAIQLNDPPERDARTVSLEMLHILEAAAGAPGALMTEAIYNMLMEPGYLNMLREEVIDVRQKYGLTNEATQHLPKLDSFLMETNRLYPVGGVTAARTIMQHPVTLHDGLILPVGTRIGFTCKSMQHDGRLFHDAQIFDGLRFVKLNEKASSGEATDTDNLKGSMKYNASMASATNLPWGYGAHTCPGRFYSIKLAKLIFMIILPRYDIEWHEDGKDGVRTVRPPSFEVEGQFLPNMQQKIRIKRREVAKVE